MATTQAIRKFLGDALIEKGYLATEQLDRALAAQQDTANRGKLLG